MVTRVSRNEAARHLGISISTIDRQIQRGQLSIEKEAYGTRERVWVLLDEDSAAPSAADSSVTPGATAESSNGDISAEYVRTLEHQVQALQELSDFRQEQLKQSEWRLGQVMDNLTTAQQTIERMSRALPAAGEVEVAVEKRRSWLPWRRG